MLRHLNEPFCLPQLVGHGYLAVDFFFILSGFVICWAYEQRLATGWSNVEFVRVRLIRLLPLIALGSVLGGLATGLERPSLSHLIEATLLSMATMPFPWRGALFPVNGPLWSMFYELVSNGVYVAARPLLGRKVLLSTMMVAALAVIVVAVRIGNLDAGFLIHHGWAGAPRLAFPFLAGVLIYRFYVRDPSSRFAAPAWMLAVALVAVLVLPEVNGPGGAALDILCSLVVLPALVWFGVRARVGARVARMCAVAGELSYPVYVIHKPIEIAAGHLADRWATPWRAMAAGGCVVVIFSLASLAARRYDAPIRRRLTAWRPRSKTATGAVTPSAARRSAGATP